MKSDVSTRPDFVPPVRGKRARVRYNEFDVFTNTMLLFALVLGMASEIVDYSNALVEQALAECQIVRESLGDCMASKGYLLIKGDRSGAPDGWQRESLHRLLDESYIATRLEDDSADVSTLH